jgi:hypothetical protein
MRQARGHANAESVLQRDFLEETSSRKVHEWGRSSQKEKGGSKFVKSPVNMELKSTDLT